MKHPAAMYKERRRMASACGWVTIT